MAVTQPSVQGATHGLSPVVVVKAHNGHLLLDQALLKDTVVQSRSGGNPNHIVRKMLQLSTAVS